MKELDLAYAAGYIDGDGCFAIANNLTYSLKKKICDEILKLKKTEFCRSECSPRHPKFMEWFEPVRKEKESIYQSVCHLNNTL